MQVPSGDHTESALIAPSEVRMATSAWLPGAADCHLAGQVIGGEAAERDESVVGGKCRRCRGGQEQ